MARNEIVGHRDCCLRHLMHVEDASFDIGSSQRAESAIAHTRLEIDR